MNKESQAYIKAKRDADKKFKEKTSAYKSMYIVSQYKKYNGKFLSSKEKKKGLTRWLNEKWIRVDPKTGKPMRKNGKLVDCGRSKSEKNNKIKKGMCRPYKRITKDTPKTVKELGKKEIKRRLKKKKKYPDKKLSGGKKNSLKKTNLKKKKMKKKNNNKNNIKHMNNNDKTLHESFKPNLTPKEVFAKGAFGGTYFRPIYSSITKKHYKSKDVIKEYPKSWFKGIDIEKMVTSSKYDKNVNKYGVKCGSDLKDWEKSGWMHKQDPYGWFQWYCRFYMGRRTDDDERQIKRWLALAGPKGRFKNRLINMIKNKGAKYDDESISPVIRQTLLHWGYQITPGDLK